MRSHSNRAHFLGRGKGRPLLSDVNRYITPKHKYEELGEGVIKA
jgi:hypothetical protein